MSTVPLRSSTGCLTCKCRRKKCDETKPSCLRCQKSGLECPGYVYIQWKNNKASKLRTLPAPREKKTTAQTQDTDQAAPDSFFEEQIRPADIDAGAGSMNLSNFTFVPDQTELLQDVDSWPNLVHDDTLTGSYFMSSGTAGQSWAPSASSIMLPSPPAGDSTPMTHGQASLLNALFSLGDSSNSVVFSHNSTANGSATCLSSGSIWPSPDTEEDDASSEEEDCEGVTQIICQPLVLDKNAESNALPFILQSYATWVARMAYEPLKMAQLVRGFIFTHFEDSQESRWTLTLLANIVGQLGRRVFLDETHLTIIPTLQTQVRRRLVRVKTVEDTAMIRSQSIKALDATLETMVIHVFASPLSKWLTLWKEAAPLFRRLCPEPPGSPINLLSLSQHPDICLRHYAHIDVLCSSLMDSPMLFRYDCTPQNIQSTREATGESQFQTGAQWLHGMPDRFLAVFAKINAMREDGWVATPEIIAVFEHGIQEFQPSQTNCRDSFLSVTRLVVQECWRQAAYVYLYMGLCGDSSDTPRVKQVVKQFMKLLDGTKPGRMPDEFLVLSFILVSPATQKKRDRETIRKRIQGLWVNGYGHGADNMNMIESIWAHADAEGRPVVWSDISKARMRVIGM